MAIKAVVLDIGSVLEIIDDSVFPGPWVARLGLDADEFSRALGGLGGDAVTGEVGEQEVYDHWQRCLGLTDAQLHDLREDFWRWYLGTLDQELFDWFAGLRPRFTTGIVSNSGPGARERERPYGFESVTDAIVYSHEVGLKKPDPMIYALTAERLAVQPQEIVFLDDVAGNIEAARRCRWHGVVHEEGNAQASIREIESLIGLRGRTA